MDLGATLCTRARPACTVCPLAAELRGMPHRHASQVSRAAAEARARRSAVRLRSSCGTTAGGVLLERRPERGVWGGLYCLPELGVRRDAARVVRARARHVARRLARELATIEHSFTHFDLDLTPWLVTLAVSPSVVMDRADRLWYNPSEDLAVGVPAPVAVLLHALDEPLVALQQDERRIA